MFPFPLTPNEFVVWLGGATAAGVIFSVLLERFLFFQKLDAKVKCYVVLALFVLLPLVAMVIQFYLGLYDKPLPTTPYGWVTLILALLIQGLMSWSASQLAHPIDKQNQ